jgi:hypothetical protein
MQQIGYSLVSSTGDEIQVFGNIPTQCAEVPTSIALSNGDVVHAPSLGEVFSDQSRLVPRFYSDTPPAAPWFLRTGELVSFDGAKVTVTPVFSSSPDAIVRKETIDAECARRIFAVASSSTQANLSANFLAGNLSAEQVAAYKNGVAWIGSMQAACRAMIAAGDVAYAQDAKWPAPPADGVALAAQF